MLLKYDTDALKGVKGLTLVSMLIALSAVGAMVKLFNTVALDSTPGYFAALYLGAWYGAIVISLGHLLTAFTSGFPLGIFIHIYIAIQMAIYACLFRYCYERFNSLVGILAATLLNGPLAALLLVPIFGWGFFLGWSLPLSFGSFVNIFLAALIYKGMDKVGGR
ncbi:MAG: ECF transporter S component [Tissierellia bacterium]|nr:ECF transporter S component [Tissierellia bacterium]